MKITKIDVFRVDDPNDPKWHPILCRVYTDEGIYGDGEAAMAYGIGNKAAYGMIQDLAELVVGMDPLDNEIIWNKLYRSTFWGQNGGCVVTAGISAIDLALWDIRGKFFNVPVYRLLGGKLNDNLRTYASQLQFGWRDSMGALFTVNEYVDAAKRAVGEGYDAIKVDFFTFKPEGGSYIDKDRTTLLSPEILGQVVDRVAAVREAVGPKVDIIIENHSYPDAQSAVQLAQAVEKYNIYYFEEPNTPDPQTSRYISSKINIPIANGERIYTRWEYKQYFQDNILQVAQPDLGTCGGITEAKKICDMAYAYDVSVQIHACGSPLSTAAALQVEAAIPNFIIHEHHQINLTANNIRLCRYNYQPENGRMKVPDLPGLGNEWSDYTLNETQKVTVVGGKAVWCMQRRVFDRLYRLAASEYWQIGRSSSNLKLINLCQPLLLTDFCALHMPIKASINLFACCTNRFSMISPFCQCDLRNLLLKRMNQQDYKLSLKQGFRNCCNTIISLKYSQQRGNFQQRGYAYHMPDKRLRVLQ